MALTRHYVLPYGCMGYACEEKAFCAWFPPGPSCSCLPMMCPITLCTSSFHGNTSVSARTSTYITTAARNIACPVQCCLLHAAVAQGKDYSKRGRPARC